MLGIRRVLSRVRGKLPLFAFSNTNAAHQASLTRFAELLSPFQKIYLSNKLGARKPEAAAFKAVIADIGVAPDRVLFFDDNAENVAGARAFGLQAVQVASSTEVDEAISRMVLTNS